MVNGDIIFVESDQASGAQSTFRSEEVEISLAF
jgi:hypothetical protein